MQTMLERLDSEESATVSTEQYLLQQLRDGDDSAVEIYVRSYFDGLLRLGLLSSPSEQSAYDAVEAALIHVARLSSQSESNPDPLVLLQQQMVAELEQAWRQTVDRETWIGAIARLDPADRWAYLISNWVPAPNPDVLKSLNLDTEQFEHHRKRALALLGVERFTEEQVAHILKSRPMPTAEARAVDEQRLINELQRLLADDRQRLRKRILTLEVIWAILGISVLVLGYSVFTSIEASAIGSQETAIADTEPTATALGAFEPTKTPLPYEATQANGRSYAPAISQDGRYIVFVSEATNLVGKDNNGLADIFLFDRVSEEMTLISQGIDGQPADGASGGPSISANGRYVAFTSRATNLVTAPKILCSSESGIEQPCADVYLYDREGAEIIPVTQARGLAGNGDSGVNPWGVAPAEKTGLSPDGSVIAFYSRAEDLGADPLYGGLYLYQWQEQELVRVDQPHDGSAVNGSSYWPTLSQDGRLLAFTTLASNLVSDDTNNQADIFVYDRLSRALTRITTGPSGTGANGASVMPALSADGRWLAFRSEATDLVEGDFNGTADVFLHDLQAGVTRLVSANDQGLSGNRASSSPTVSSAGEISAFTSLAGDLIEPSLPGSWEVYLYNRLDNSLQPASRGLVGLPADGPSTSPQLSGDGLLVVFSSAASNLVEEDLNGVEDIFLFQRGSGLLLRINVPRQ